MTKPNLYSKDYFQKRNALSSHLAETLGLLIKTSGGKKILDVGCGTGQLVKFFKKEGFAAVGCDNSNEAVRISGQIKASAVELPFKTSSFSWVTAVSLIEHLRSKDARKFLEETRRVLKPKGCLFLVTPNFLSPMRFVKGKKWFGYLDPTHVRFYSPLSLKQLLEEHHFSDFRFRFRVNPKTPADWPFFLPSLPQTLQFLLNCLLISSPLAYLRDSFWVLAQKKE